ncbi:MAG: alpha/beta hydrolase [Candidatus Omnitrophica bacterium]|nr:alpha/beta hydrolase [Candidatus Omnitrophota bacterium]
MKINKMPGTIFILLIILACGWFYFRYFEIRSIYFPIGPIEFTPKEVGLLYEDIFFKTKDNKLLNGWFVPKDSSRGTIIFCHGNAGNISHRLEFIKMFHNLGLSVFIFDYRGYGKSKGTPTEKGTYLDAEASYGYVSSRSDIDKEKIIIYGESLGSAVAVDLATNVNAKVLITFGCFTRTEDMAKRIYPFLPLWLMVSMKYDSLYKIKGIKIPKLIIHSQNDEIVPFDLGKKVFKEAPEPKEFYMMRGGHNDAILINREEFLERIDEFLRKNGV